MLLWRWSSLHPHRSFSLHSCSNHFICTSSSPSSSHSHVIAMNRRKCSPAPSPVNYTADLREKQSPRSPLKDFNGISSSCSSSTSSMSIEVPKGCLRFFVSNSSTSSSSRPLHKPTRTPSKTPKSAPNVRPSKSSRSKIPKENLPKPIISAKQEKRGSNRADKSKNNPPCLYQWQSGKKSSSRTKTGGILVNKLAPGSEKLKQHHQHQQPSPECSARNTGDTDNAAATGEITEIGMFDLKDKNFTPVSKLACGSALDCGFDKATLPPVEASISPEIQCGLPLNSTTPVCYGAGHLISGVPDKRKCRPRGILTIGDNGLDFDKAKTFDDDNVDEATGGVVNISRLSLVPLPTEASMNWHLSPCNEEDEDQNGLYDNWSNRSRRLVSSNTSRSPSPSSGHGFSSDICKSSNNADIGTNTTARRRRRSNSLLSLSGLPELQGLSSPLSDNMDCCSLPSSSPHATPTCKNIVSQEENKHSYDIAGENSPFSLNSLGSENVIQTPKSDSSLDRDVGLCWLNANDNKKHLFESEFDSVAEVLQETSFQFDHLSTSDSIDFTQLQKNWERGSWISNSTLENVSQSQSQVRISWREGLVSRIFEMDELDCCRCLSDEEEDAHDCRNDLLTSHLSTKLNFDVSNDQILTNASGSLAFVGHDPEIDGRGKEKFPLQRPSACAESISTDGGDLVASGDSDWTLCYRNQLFQV